MGSHITCTLFALHIPTVKSGLPTVKSGLPTVKLIFSKRGLGKCKTVGEVKAIKSKK